jgi:hypothetical protein
MAMMAPHGPRLSGFGIRSSGSGWGRSSRTGGSRSPQIGVGRSVNCLTRGRATRPRPPPAWEERKIANVTRHRNVSGLRGYIRAATAFGDVGDVL